MEFNLLTLAEDEKERLAAWISFYKTWRHLLHAEVWGGTAGDSLSWHAAGTDAERLLFILREKPMQFRHMPPMRLPFADPNARYRLTPVGPGATGDAFTCDGAWLAQSGLAVPHMKAESAVIFRMEAIEA